MWSSSLTLLLPPATIVAPPGPHVKNIFVYILTAPYEHKIPLFWVREKQGATSEIDFIFEKAGRVIPVKIKSGKIGRLRSLMQFVDDSGADMAIRLYRGPYSHESVKTLKGKPFTLVNLPYFLVARVKDYVSVD